jgi:hypothetical protein
MKLPKVLLLSLGTTCTVLSAPAEPEECGRCQPLMVEAWAPTKAVETVYELRGYRDPKRPHLRHEGHKVYRRTLVPIGAADDRVETGRVLSAAHAPLPLDAELEAERATQRALTEEVQALQRSMQETEKAMRAQHAELIRQAATVQKLREELEAERNRLRQLQASESLGEAIPDASAKATAAPW